MIYLRLIFRIFVAKIKFIVMTLRIKEVIKERSLNVQDVAERMNISRVGLSQHINGNPSVEVLERIATAIGCSVGEFFEQPKQNIVTCPNCGTRLKVEKE